MVFAIAEQDPTIFREDSQRLCAALAAAGKKVTLQDLPGLDHFNAIELLASEEYSLTHVLASYIV